MFGGSMALQFQPSASAVGIDWVIGPLWLAVLPAEFAAAAGKSIALVQKLWRPRDYAWGSTPARFIRVEDFAAKSSFCRVIKARRKNLHVLAYLTRRC